MSGNGWLSRIGRGVLSVLGFGGSSQAPIMLVDSHDPRLLAAEEEARRRWPEFLQAFTSASAGTGFCVKSPFPTTSGRVEHIWVEVERVEGDSIFGRLGNPPMENVGVREGDAVSVVASQIEDWVYEDAKGELVGGFSLQAMLKIQREASRRG